jgi:hypothetical protein
MTPTAPSAAPTAPHRLYYLHNFRRALDWISARYPDVLGESEHAFASRFATLPQPAQALMVRLVMRRGPWFRASRLAYDEIGDVRAAAAPLLAAGWLDADAPMTLDELGTVHTLPELRALFRHADPQGLQGAMFRTLPKPALLAALRNLYPAAQPYAQWCPGGGDVAWRVTVGDLCTRLRLMFFGNLYQDWSEFVLADLGLFRYETVPFDARSRAFQSRADVDHYLALQKHRDALDEDAPVDHAALLHTVQQCTSANPWLERRRAKLLMRIGQACEKAQNWPLAAQAYASSQHPGARHRHIRVHERMGLPEQALHLALQAQAAPESEEESQRLARMLPRLVRCAPQTGTPLPLPRQRRARLQTSLPTPLDITLPRPTRPAPAIDADAPLQPEPTVEWALRNHWHTEAAPVFYTENALINSLFGLLCWPALFAPLPGAFFHPFQSGPADLDAPDFVARRADLFAQCLQPLEDGSYRNTLLQRYEDKHGLQSPYVFWSVLTRPLLALALQCIPAAHLRLFFARMLQSPVAHRTGFPDLVRFWPAEQRYALVEVKGPGDKLQDNQIRWLQYCHHHGLPATVCHVRWQENHTATAHPVPPGALSAPGTARNAT